MQKLILAISVLLVTACASTGRVDYNRMTTQEVAEYNQTAALMDQVYCTEDVRIGSHIRKRYCAPLNELVDEYLRSMNKINALHIGTSLTFR